jgi:large subunit ribosomal protein L25
MKTVEIIGFKRANLGKKESKDLRLESNVPCVLYGGNEQLHFHTPAYLFKDIVYTGDTPKVILNFEGKQHECVLQDIQFDPVNEQILHADFLLLRPEKEVNIFVPVTFSGTSPGVVKGGKLVVKMKKIKIKSLPKNIPDAINIDISKLELGKSVKISEVKAENFLILANKSLPIASIDVPRALKGAGAAAND